MSHHAADHPGSGRPLLAAIAAILVLYGAAVVMGWPQHATSLVVSGGHHEDDAHDTGEHAADEHAEHAIGDEDAHRDESHEEAGSTKDADVGPTPDYYIVIPFMLLLGAIAVFPLMHATEHWWESNLHRFYVSAGLAIVVLLYYLFVYPHPVDGHWPAHRVVEPVAGQAAQWSIAGTVLSNAILGEYIPFIMLLFSLYTISGGIRITGDLRAHPATNSAFLLIGSLLASFIGTTGAAMLLIRPLLETNLERKHVQHTVIFFIFMVCNCAGLLLPIGDPPLFLGYLQGVDFFWTLNLWREWLFVNGLLLVLYFLVDTFIYYPREQRADIIRDVTQTRRLRISGLGLNGPLLVGVVFCVALLDPSKTIPFTDWHPWMYLREIAQLGLVGLSLGLGAKAVRRDNQFNYHAILEVAALFLGIFICMQPALQILAVKGASLNLDSPDKFFWATGILSSVLDNAPTYLVFFQTAKALPPVGTLEAGVNELLLTAISLGAVFMGAMTYIGNGPNFMVKAIAEKSGVKMPSFFGYMVFSIGVLLPIFVLMTWLFV